MNVAYFQFDGDSLNKAMTSAMVAAVNQLANEGLISVADSEEFNSKHAIVMVTKTSFLRSWAERIGWLNKLSSSENSIAICVTLPKPVFEEVDELSVL